METEADRHTCILLACRLNYGAHWPASGGQNKSWLFIGFKGDCHVLREFAVQEVAIIPNHCFR